TCCGGSVEGTTPPSRIAGPSSWPRTEPSAPSSSAGSPRSDLPDENGHHRAEGGGPCPTRGPAPSGRLPGAARISIRSADRHLRQAGERGLLGRGIELDLGQAAVQVVVVRLHVEVAVAGEPDQD